MVRGEGESIVNSLRDCFAPPPSHSPFLKLWPCKTHAFLTSLILQLKRRVEGDKLLDDDALERMLYAEFSAVDDDEEDERDLSQGSADDDGYDDDDEFENENDELDDELYDGPNYEDVIQARSYAGSQTSSDVIEAYDEEGNLVGTYTDEEWEELKRRQR